MARLREGDLSALGQLAELYQMRVVSFAYRLLGDWHAAEDVAQETFLRVRRAAGSYQPQAQFTTWLYRIVYHLSVDHQRRGAKRPASPEALDGAGQEKAASDTAERNEMAQLVREAIHGLSERQRRVVVLHRYEGLSHGEIAEVTGWSQSAVESLLVRAYANLRKKLTAHRDYVV